MHFSIYKPPYEIVTGDLSSENSCSVKMVIESMNFQKCRNSFCEMKYLRYRSMAPKEYRKYAFHQFSTGILKLQCDSQLHVWYYFNIKNLDFPVTQWFAIKGDKKNKVKGVLPDWKQREYGLVLFISILSVYDTNESEVYSMALNDNIKRLREEKDLTQQQLADKMYVSRQTICRWENGSRCPDLITAKRLALELEVSMDELISDEDVRDIESKYGIGKTNKIKTIVQLQGYQKKIRAFLEIIGSIFLVISLFALKTNESIPWWLIVVFAVPVIVAFVFLFRISRKIDRI